MITCGVAFSLFEALFRDVVRDVLKSFSLRVRLQSISCVVL